MSAESSPLRTAEQISRRLQAQYERSRRLWGTAQQLIAEAKARQERRRAEEARPQQRRSS
jgi:hypothetical protein